MKKRVNYIVIACMVCLVALTAILVIGFRVRYGNHTLIVYFSRVGNTNFSSDVDAISSASLQRDHSGKLRGNAEILADDIHGFTGADVHEIQVSDMYPEDYEETVGRASEERSQNTKPELINHIDNMEDYDNIILIYPVWWSTAPMPVYTFLEEYDFKGKTIVPIATHKGSFLGSSVSDLKQALPQSDVKNGIPISGSSVRFLIYWLIGVLTGIGLLVLSVVKVKKCKEKPSKAKMWFACEVVSLVLIVICALKLLI